MSSQSQLGSLAEKIKIQMGDFSCHRDVKNGFCMQKRFGKLPKLRWQKRIADRLLSLCSLYEFPSVVFIFCDYVFLENTAANFLLEEMKSYQNLRDFSICRALGKKRCSGKKVRTE